MTQLRSLVHASKTFEYCSCGVFKPTFQALRECEPFSCGWFVSPSDLLVQLDNFKTWGAVGHPHPGHTFVPGSVEKYGHLGRPIMGYLRTLSDSTTEPPLAVNRWSFLACAHRELSAALV
jgi:hypothetical protein